MRNSDNVTEGTHYTLKAAITRNCLQDSVTYWSKVVKFLYVAPVTSKFQNADQLSELP